MSKFLLCFVWLLHIFIMFLFDSCHRFTHILQGCFIGTEPITCFLQYQYAVYRFDDVVKWKHFPRYWPLWGESTGHQWIPVDSTHKGQWRGALVFSLICAWTVEQTIEMPLIWDAITLMKFVTVMSHKLFYLFVSCISVYVRLDLDRLTAYTMWLVGLA